MFTPARIFCLAAVAALSTSACDRWDLFSSSAETTVHRNKVGGAAHKKAAGTQTLADAAGQPADVASCQRACDDRKDLSETDRATCRLNCAPPDLPDKAAPDVAARLAFCCRRCDVDPALSGTDAATCRLNCAAQEERAVGDCSQKCIDSMLAAWVRCSEAERPTDQATCRLTAENAARACDRGCENSA